MREDPKKAGIIFGILMAVLIVCMLIANCIQTVGGKVDVTMGVIETELGDLTYKLYTPVTATAEHPAPGVLLLHGYQNDHETCAAYAIELARRGAVVMAVDEYGHGSTDIGLLNRGYVNHKVTVNYGEDSEENGTFVEIGGAKRYRLMMNFSNLSFFDERYSTDAEGNVLTDSSCGGISAYAALAAMPNVDASRLAVSGHSMGTWSSWSVAAAFSGSEIEPKATVLQCGELFRDSAYDTEKYHFNNVLLLQAKWDEFSYFRDYKPVVNDELLHSELRTEFLGVNAGKAAWNTTFGSFEDGSARRMELLYTNHRLTTHHGGGLTTALEWFDKAIGLDTDLPATNHIAVIKEWLTLLAMFCALASMLPIMELLLWLPVYSEIAQPLPPNEGIKTPGKWWTGAIITMLLSFATYPFMTQLGHGLLPLPEGVFRMTIGNGFLSWYLLLILIMLGTVIASRSKHKKGLGGSDYYNMGLSCPDAPEKISLSLMGRSALLAFCMLLIVYILVCFCEILFQQDFRLIWPFFKHFSGERFLQFCVYLPVFALFFVLNNSKILAGQRTAATYEPGFKGFMGCWWRTALQMTGGILLIILLEYIPFFAGIGPGADLLFGSTFGGPFMSLLIVFFPQVLVFSVLCTYIYRRTGSVWVGAFTVASLACWIVTGGSSML